MFTFGSPPELILGQMLVRHANGNLVVGKVYMLKVSISSAGLSVFSKALGPQKQKRGAERNPKTRK